MTEGRRTIEVRTNTEPLPTELLAGLQRLDSTLLYVEKKDLSYKRDTHLTESTTWRRFISALQKAEFLHIDTIRSYNSALHAAVTKETTALGTLDKKSIEALTLCVILRTNLLRIDKTLRKILQAIRNKREPHQKRAAVEKEAKKIIELFINNWLLAYHTAERLLRHEATQTNI